MIMTIVELADHIEMTHEREIAPGTRGLRHLHNTMHQQRNDWGHTHAHGEYKSDVHLEARGPCLR